MNKIRSKEEAIAILKGLWTYLQEDIRQALEMAIKALEQEPSGDSISRQAVLDYIYNDLGLGDEENGKDVERQMELEDSYRYVKSLPSVNPQEPTGYWIFEGNQCFSCSSCGRIYTQKAFEYLKLHKDEPDFPNNCPNCGRKMFKTGSWLFYGRLLKCSNCGYINDDILDECPNCKISMIEPQESEDN